MAFGDLITNGTGTLTGTAGIGASNVISINGGTGVAVQAGDLVVVVYSEANSTVNATACTDNLSGAGSYTAQNAGTNSGGGISGRMFYRVITGSGTLTSVTLSANTGGAGQWALCAAVFSGPFALTSTLDTPNGSPANKTTDVTSPLACPSTVDPLSQAVNLVIAWAAYNNNSVLSATAPNTMAVNARAGNNSDCGIGYQVTSGTGVVTPNFTVTLDPGVDVLGTATFKSSPDQTLTQDATFADSDQFYVAARLRGRLVINGAEAGAPEVEGVMLLPDAQRVSTTIFNDAGGKGGSRSYYNIPANNAGYTPSRNMDASGLLLPRAFCKMYFYHDGVQAFATSPDLDTVSFLLAWFYDASLSSAICAITLLSHKDGTHGIRIDEYDFATGSETTISYTPGTWVRFDLDVTFSNTHGVAKVYQDGTLVKTTNGIFANATSDPMFKFRTLSYAFFGSAGADSYYLDDIEVDDTALIGESYVVCRQFKTGAPTYNDWTKVG